MNIIVTDPIPRRVVQRDYWGVNGALVTITFECGHWRTIAAISDSGEVVLECWSCGVRREDEARQLELWE